MKTTARYLITFMVFCIVLVGLGYLYLPSKDLHPLRVEQEEVKAEVKTPVVDKKQLTCLADNIYYEAGSEPKEGKAAVARVVLNRILHGGFGNTPCKVVYQATNVKQLNEETDQEFWIRVCQFSWVCEGKSNPNRNSARYQSSLQIAYDVLAYNKYEEVITKNTLFFHNTSVINQFPHEVTARIGNHIFYAKKKVKRAKQKPYRYNKKPESSLVLNGKVPSKVDGESI